MDSRLNLLDLSDSINKLEQDFNTKQNASCSGSMDESELYCVDFNNVPKSFSEKSIDCNVEHEFQRDYVKNSEEVSDLKSNVVLRYIRQLLLEEDKDEEINTSEEELVLLATEKAFEDIIKQEYYSQPDEPLLHDPAIQTSSVDDCDNENSNYGGERELTKYGSSASEDQKWSLPESLPQQIEKGVEEALKFLPNIGEFFVSEYTGSTSNVVHQSKSKKNPSYSDLDQLVGRAQKQIVPNCDEPIRNEKFDKVLLRWGQKYIQNDPMLCEQKEIRDVSRKIQAKNSTYAIDEDKNQTTEEVVDLRSLLIYCSELVSANDHSKASEVICKIRKYSSPYGDWSQRLACYFVDALEARLTGSGSEIYRKILSKKPNIIEILRVFRSYLMASPYLRTVMYFTNQTILNNISKNAEKVHIINYGIRHGFQWPSFFEHFSNWERTPPIIRFTMVEVPEPGFRPRKRVELIGQRLADYAKSFNVPFEYEGIASKWENVKVEDLKIRSDEVVIVNCIVHSERLSDESVGTDSPKDTFLHTIRKIKPHIFIHGTMNGSYNSPLFLRRFRSALSHYSSLFEMLDSNLPQDSPGRLIMERDVFIPEITNVIACEGSERLERPETYQQWHTRKLRAGLVPLPVDPIIKKHLKDFVRRYYHKEFVIDEDNGWLLVGWKGRILHGFSSWKSN